MGGEEEEGVVEEVEEGGEGEMQEVGVEGVGEVEVGGVGVGEGEESSKDERVGFLSFRFRFFVTWMLVWVFLLDFS